MNKELKEYLEIEMQLKESLYKIRMLSNSYDSRLREVNRRIHQRLDQSLTLINFAIACLDEKEAA